jgi:hypothetical protein
MSEVVSRAVDEQFHHPANGLMLVAQGERKPTAVLDRVWSPHEYERVVRLAVFYPELLGENERYLWTLILDESKYWTRKGKSGAPPSLENVAWAALAADWKKLTAKAGRH